MSAVEEFRSVIRASLHGVRDAGVIESLLDELNMRLGLGKDGMLVITSYRPGRERYYQIVYKRFSDNAEIAWSPWMRKEALMDALKLAVNVARYASKHKDEIK